MILITGAAGKTGKAILRKLAEQMAPVKALVLRAAQVAEVEALGAKAVIVGDMRDGAIIRRAMQGVQSVYHICPNVHPDEITIGKEIIDAAASTGITQFVYHSVLHPQIEEMPHHWKKMRVEEHLFASGLPFTILQPAVYMQNILVNWEQMIETGRYTIPYAVESRISMVDLEDVALAAALVLREALHEGGRSPHNGATYELAGTAPMSQSEVAAILSQGLGRTVTAESVSIDAWKNKVRTSGLDEYPINTLGKMFAYYAEHGLSGNSQVLSWLLNRPATSFEAFVKRAVEDRLHVAR
jgi:uncharacterized protein YbjT (DUF2867 family)